MKFVKFAVFAVLAALSAQSVDAGVFGSALFQTSNMRVQYSTTGTAGSFSDATAAQVNVVFTNLTVTNTATLNGTTVGAATVYTAAPVIDDPQEFISNLNADSAPAENTFAKTSPVSVSAFARSDSYTTGGLIFPGGLNTDSISEIEAVDSSLGGASSTSGGFSSFTINANQGGFYRLIFDAIVDLQVEALGPPNQRETSASSALTVQINGASVSLDSLAGVVTQDVSTSGAATSSGGVYTNLTTGNIELLAGSANLLTIGQTTSVSLLPVPEPSSMLAFAGLGLIGLARRRRRA